MELLIKNAHIIDSVTELDGDVYIVNGIINEIGQNIEKNCNVIDGTGLTLMPAFVDLHAHFRDPGLTHKEDLLSGSMAAVKGGYTAVNLMANTKPVCSSLEVISYVRQRSREIGLVDIHQTASVTNNFDGISIEHIDELDDEVKFISDDGKGVEENEVLLRAMLKAAERNIAVISHAEYEKLNKYDTRLSENIMTKRDIELARFSSCHLHMAHVSTREAMQDVISAKNTGVRVTCEVTPHHLYLTGEKNYRVNPPLREKQDIDFLVKAIGDGYVDAIATDHAPHTKEDKNNGAPGISGIETAFSICYTKLVRESGVSLNMLSKLMSEKPAKMLGLNKGRVHLGYDGDMVLIDTNAKVVVDSEKFESKGKNTPFDGIELYGEVVFTIKSGRIVYSKE